MQNETQYTDLKRFFNFYGVYMECESYHVGYGYRKKLRQRGRLGRAACRLGPLRIQAAARTLMRLASAKATISNPATMMDTPSQLSALQKWPPSEPSKLEPR